MTQNTSSAVMQQRREDWRPVSGWPGYDVSSEGQVRSWKMMGPGRKPFVCRDREPKVLKPCVRNGYPSVLFCEEGVRQWVSIHVLVLEAFVGPRPVGCHAAHNDGRKANSRLTNLRWATPAENNADKRQHGTHQHGGLIGTAKLTDSMVEEIREKRRSGQSVQQLARQFAVCRNTITNITTGRSWRESHASAFPRSPA